MEIILQPVSFEPYEDIISLLERHLSEEFGISIINIASLPIKELPCFCLINIETGGNQAIYCNGFGINISQACYT
jgi:hypothetical protein